MKSKGKLIELLLCIPIGIYTTLLLLEVCITTMQPLTNKLENMIKTGTEYGIMLEEIGEVKW